MFSILTMYTQSTEEHISARTLTAALAATLPPSHDSRVFIQSGPEKKLRLIFISMNISICTFELSVSVF